MKTFGLHILGLSLCLSLTSALAGKGEKWDRNVDRVALLSQRQAIEKYAKLAKKYAGTEQERPIRVRMLEAMEGAANLEFRIAHGDAHLKKQPVQLKKYQDTLRNVIETATKVIKLAPLADENHRIYFVRAQALAELRMIESSKKDYITITQKFPNTTWSVRSNLALAGFATEAGNHKEAIKFLKEVEQFPEDPHLPFALYQLGWAYYNLNEIDTAIDYLKRNIVYYRRKADESEAKTLSQSEAAYMEHSLRDVVTFFFEGHVKGISGYGLQNALALFRQVEPGERLGMMLVFFAKQLRTRNLVESLGEWQAQIIEEEWKRPEAIEVVMINVDCLYVRSSWDMVVSAATGFRRLDEKTEQAMRQTEAYVKAQKQILDVADALQKAIAKSKVEAQTVKLSRILVGMYGNFIAIVDEKDPRLLQIHYNLGETLFSIKDYESATFEYVWVLEHWQKSKLKKEDVALKAISSRYQFMSQKNLLPKELKPAKLSEQDSVDLEDVEPKVVAEWIKWVDDYIDDYGRGSKAIEEFEFEANRMLYVRGQSRAALARMLKQVKASPTAAVSQGAASLVLDTYVFDKQWELLLDASELFIDTPKLGNAEFRKRLEGLPADASLKLIEDSYEAKDFSKVISAADRFRKKYDKSPRLSDALFLASRAADQSGEKNKALSYVSELLTKFPKTEKRSVALLARATLEDATHDFDAAAKDYQEYLATAKGKDVDRRGLLKRLMFVKWLSKSPVAPSCRGLDEALEVECDRYHALVALGTGTTTESPSALIKKGLHGPKETRAVWAAVGLKLGGKKIGYSDRLSLAQSLAVGVKDLDPMIQFVLVPVINTSIPEAYNSFRSALPKIASLKSSQEAIARRIGLIRHFETTATKVVGLPWARVKVAVLAEVAQVYVDFCDELAKLQPPDGLSPEELAEYKKSVKEILDPFKEKGNNIRGQVMELAAEFPVFPEDVVGYVPPADRAPAGKPEPIDVGLFSRVGPAKPELFPLWEEAIKAKSWARAGFFFQQIKEKDEPSEPTLALMRGIALAVAGAQPEALAELESAHSNLSSGAASLGRVLYEQYGRSTAFKKAKETWR